MPENISRSAQNRNPLVKRRSYGDAGGLLPFREPVHQPDISKFKSNKNKDHTVEAKKEKINFRKRFGEYLVRRQTIRRTKGGLRATFNRDDRRRQGPYTKTPLESRLTNDVDDDGRRQSNDSMTSYFLLFLARMPCT
ncbi:hypothetical protein RUM44_001848 [Polyplax serrata]|uniref:Uncharacterized protein n=1 Tax=Polyplax serrata TaxID=468196 RepID=A0ABR1ALA9_POLSC